MLNIKKINYNENYESGCETCDYGSSYVNEIEITLEDDTCTNIEVDKMYDYVLSKSDYIQLISNSNNMNEFIMNIIKKIKKESYREDIGWLIKLEALSIIINGQEVDILKSLKKQKIIFKENE